VRLPVGHSWKGSLARLRYSEGAFPIAENLAKVFLSLPMFPELTEEQIEYVARCVSETAGAKVFAYGKNF
jgi:dTDP-4-amino-4,6-dideoxygalactose transaminase